MNELTLNDYLVLLKRHKAAFYSTFLTIFALVIVVTVLWSNYRSTTTIEIQQPEVSAEITAPLGATPNEIPESFADSRVNRINQNVTSQSSLMEIITKYDLYRGARKSGTLDVVADRMAKAIKLKLISSELANPNASQKVSADALSAIAFTLSFDYNDPVIAQKVTTELANRFLEEDLKERRTQAESTSVLLDKQIKTLEESMADQEKKIADFENKNGVSRPETLLFNQQASANAAISLQTVDSQIAANEGTQGTLQSQLASVEPYSRVIADGQVLTTPAIQLKALKAQYATLTAHYGPEHPDIVKLKHQIAALEEDAGKGNQTETARLKAQIVDAQANYTAALKTYGGKNPDVIALKKELNSLEKSLSEAKHHPQTKASHQDADNPAYIGLMSQLHSLDEQHKSLVEQRAKIAEQADKYQKAILQNPLSQQQMAELSRDYDNAQLRYRDLKSKKLAADMDKQMIEERRSEQLTIISPPNLPLGTHPKRILLFLGGLILAIMGSLCAVMIRHMMDQSIYGARQVESVVGVAPLVVIPFLPKGNGRNSSLYEKTQSIFHGIADQPASLNAAYRDKNRNG